MGRDAPANASGEPVSESLLYLDHNATTPVDPRVIEAMLPFFGSYFGNAASRQHAAGRWAAKAVEEAREEVAQILGADTREIVWTSGATESNNLAIRGVARAAAYANKRHIITVATEHHAVLDPVRTLEEEGFAVSVLGVDGQGHLDLAKLAASIREDTLLVSVMHANNESGLLHPVSEIGGLCRERGVLFHTDATQSFGKELIDVEAMSIDLLSLSAHKFYGPKGAGALYVRRRGPRVRCRALFDGGGHERGMRSGTLNVPGIVGLARAAGLAAASMDAERTRLGKLRDRFEGDLANRLGGVLRNGGPERLAGTANLAFEDVEAESLLGRMPTIAASSSSACTSASIQPSHVLGAMGFDENRIAGSVRFSLGRGTGAVEIDRAVGCIATAVEAERTEGPRSACAR